MEEIKIIERSDGFQFLVLNNTQIADIFSSDSFELYKLYNDDSEALIETVEDIEEAKQKGIQIGIQIGFKYPKIKVSEVIPGDLIKELCANGGLYQCTKRVNTSTILCNHIDGDTFDYVADKNGRFEFSGDAEFGLVHRCSSIKYVRKMGTTKNFDLYQISSPVIEWINQNLNPYAVVVIDNTSATVYQAYSHINNESYLANAYTDNK